MRAWFVALVLVWPACSAPSPDPRAMAEDLPAPREIDPASAAALAERVAAALALLQSGDPVGARQIADAVLATDPSSARARAIRGHGLMSDALQESPPRLDPWRRAEGELLRATRLAPEDPVVARLHIGFLVADGHLTAAAARVDEALAAEPDDEQLLLLGARIHFDLGDERAAIPVLRRVESLRRDDPDTAWRLAQCHVRLAPAETDAAMRRERYDDAVAAFARYRRLAPDDPDGALGEAQARLARADGVDAVDPAELERVIALYTEAARLLPTSAVPAFGQGVALELAGRAEDARSAYRAALVLDPDHVPILLNLAANLAEAGDRAAATPLLRRALELGVTADERGRIEDYLAERGAAPVDVEPPPIVAASAWGSQPQPIPDARRHEPVRITIHHAGVAWNVGDDPLRKLPALQAWGQRDKNWPDVPYHFLIAPDGRVFEGRPLGYEGDTNTEYDVRGHALIQLWGNFEEQRVTRAQLDATARLCAWLCAEHGIDPATIAAHRDWSTQTTCPGRDLYRYVEAGDVRGWAEAILRGDDSEVALRDALPGGPELFAPAN